MSLVEQLRALCEAMPPGSSVTLPRDWLRSELESRDAKTPADSTYVDLTVQQIASLLQRKESTVRGWLGSGAIPGSYRFHGREWRVPRAAFERFLEARRSGTGDERQARGRAKATDLGAWRRIRAAGGA